MIVKESDTTWLTFTKADKQGAVHLGTGAFFEALHPHPAAGRANRNREATHVLSERHAGMLLGGPVLRPEWGGGPVQAAVGYVEGQSNVEGQSGERSRFLNAAWVRWDVLDNLHLAELSGERCEDVFHAVGRLVEGGSGAGKRDTAGQGHAGPYREFGMGILAGRGRPAVRIGTSETAAAQPFFLAGSKRTEAHDGRRAGGDDEEECLARAYTIVSAALRVASPALHAELREHGFGAAPVLSQAIQYPRLERATRAGDVAMLPCHQMAVRSTKVGGGVDNRRTSTRTGRGSAECEQRASVLSGSDLHVDVMDGGGGNGSVAAFACLSLQGRDDRGQGGDDQEPAPDRDIAVFTKAPNGKKNRYYGLRAQTMHPDYLCLLTMRTSTSPHGSVFPEDIDEYVAANMPRPGYRYVRLLSYTMRDIETFVSKVGDSETAIRDAAAQVRDDRVRGMLIVAADRLGALPHD